jgi:hypothetical protein
MTKTPPPLSLFAQFQSAAQSASAARDEVRSRNPKPYGSLVAGSASSRILEFLKDQYPAWCRESMIRWKTGLSHSRVSWALNALLRSGRITSIADGARNQRYRRWRYLPDGNSLSKNIRRSDER